MNWSCAQEGCNESATHLILESHPLAMLFKGAAGLVCNQHAKEFSYIGGIPITFDEIRTLKPAFGGEPRVKDEHREWFEDQAIRILNILQAKVPDLGPAVSADFHKGIIEVEIYGAIEEHNG